LKTNEYPATKTYCRWERGTYVQLPYAVAYIEGEGIASKQ